MNKMKASQLIAAFAGSLVTVVSVAWIAFQLQQQGVVPAFFFPLLFPLITGAVSGGAFVAIARLLLPASHRLSWLPAMLVGLTVVVSQTVFSYRFYANQMERQLGRNPLAATVLTATDDFRAAPIQRFLAAQIRRSQGWWFIDAALTIAASVLTVALLNSRKPAAATSTHNHTPKGTN